MQIGNIISAAKKVLKHKLVLALDHEKQFGNVSVSFQFYEFP